MSAPAATLMVQGTGSGVGKSFLVAALCRSFARRGVRVAPFKAQNMSNNAAVTPGGGEVGRAQALQAKAAGIDCDERMNPVLLKPIADTRSEVVVLGRRNERLTELPWRERKDALWPFVCDALRRLRLDHELVVLEGAGSPAEINLREGDIANMAAARVAGAPVLLVADIDRGGAFAALYGTWALLPPGDRQRLRGFVLNRFRGDPSLLAPAPAVLERRTGVPTLGVVPRIRHRLPEEDAAALEERARAREGVESGAAGERMSDGRKTMGVRIAVVRLPRLSNFDDVDPLAGEAGVGLRWAVDPGDLEGVDAVVIPGTRNTIGDLRWLRAVGLAERIVELAEAGTPVVGLCGGYQMLGRTVRDPQGIEAGGSADGLDLLPIRTVLDAAKQTRRVVARTTGRGAAPALPAGHRIAGYEIHHGRTRLLQEPRGGAPAGANRAAARVWLEEDGQPLGVARGAVWGCYLHGAFGDDGLRRSWLRTLGLSTGAGSWDEFLEGELDRVTDTVEEALPVDRLLAMARRGVDS